MKRAVVTGGAGFIGSHLVRDLLASQCDVKVLDDLSTGRRSNLSDVLDDLEMVAMDIRDRDGVRRIVEGAEVVYHLAALPSVARSVVDPVTTHDVNASGSLNVLIACRDAGVQRVIMASSSSVYGDPQELPLREEMPVRPRSPYAASKASAEHYAEAFWRVYGLGAIILRFFNVFGPRQDPDSPYSAVIPTFLNAARTGAPGRVYGDGTQSRDFTFVRNVVHACRLAATTEGCEGEVFNCAAGQRRSLVELMDCVEKTTGKTLARIHEPARHGEVSHSVADIRKAERILGYRTVVSFDAGLRETWESMIQGDPGPITR